MVGGVRVCSGPPYAVDCWSVCEMPCVWQIKNLQLPASRRYRTHTHTHVAVSVEATEVVPRGTEVRGLGRWVCVCVRERKIDRESVVLGMRRGFVLKLS